jgi:hypothetical protein
MYFKVACGPKRTRLNLKKAFIHWIQVKVNIRCSNTDKTQRFILLLYFMYKMAPVAINSDRQATTQRKLQTALARKWSQAPVQQTSMISSNHQAMQAVQLGDIILLSNNIKHSFYSQRCYIVYTTK